MKCPESEGKGNSATEVAREDFEDFDYYWQHLRRNVGYIMATAVIWWNEMCYAQNPRSRTRHKMFHQRREFDSCCLLPTPLTRDKDSDDALRIVLKSKPDFFKTAQWQTIKAKASAHKPIAIWNWSGPHGCAWRDYHDGEKYTDKPWNDPRHDYYEHFAVVKDHYHPGLHKVGDEYVHLQIGLDITQQEAKDLNRIEHQAKRNGRTVEEERKLKEVEREEAQAKMRRFLEAHPQMDFVADTRLPWATVSRAMESEWNRIKELRRRVGLEANEQPPRKREWKKQLEIYDAYFPHWLENRKKIAALPRIWRENLGFQEAFKLLKVELAPAAAELAQRLDGQGLKPTGIFKHAAKVLRTLERASCNAALSPELSEESRRNVNEQEFYDEQGQVVPTSDFDYEAVYATLDGAEVRVEFPRSESSEAAQDILQSWRRHFSIPKPALPPSLARLRADTRREWFTAARNRIEALWPLSYEEVMGPESD